jgi:hypothetical protein
LKPGPVTTEFWVTILAPAGAARAALKGITEAPARITQKISATSLMAVYIVSRTWLKVRTPAGPPAS